MIEFEKNSRTATLSLTNQRYITKLKKLYSTRKEDFTYFKENKDGSICCKVPLKWVKVSPPKQISEETRQKMSERFIQMRADGKL